MMPRHPHVQRNQYLYVHVVKAKDDAGIGDPYVEVRVGNYKGTTRHFEKQSSPEWNQVFVFSKDRIQAHVLEVTVKDKDATKDDFKGWVLYDLFEVPKRVPTESPVAPAWCILEDRKGKKLQGELLLAVWWGAQADEAFREAWHPDADFVGGVDDLANVCSKVYLSPKLWYLRVNVVEAQDLIIPTTDEPRTPQLFVKAILGHQTLRTKASMSKSTNPEWNEQIWFVAAEPFEETLILGVERRDTPNRNEVVGMCEIHLQDVDRRLDDHTPIDTRWFDLEKHVIVEEGNIKETKFAGRIHMSICLEGGYHVFEESTDYISDVRPTAKQLWRKSIGVLEVGILSAHILIPMKANDGRVTTDAYCVAKYGTKWVRTRTVINSLTPKWNEQFTWEVYDPCTVLTIGVFDNCNIMQGGEENVGARDSRIGKVRIRLSTLENDCIYRQAYPILVLHPSGVKKMGEIVLAVRFKCSSLLNAMCMYSQPLLPKLHNSHPLDVTQLDRLRYVATQIVSMRLSQAEPPLRKEVVEYILDEGSHLWCSRRSKANFFRIMAVLSSLIAVGKWIDEMCHWKSPITTIVVHIFFFVLVLYPVLILPSIFLSLFLFGVWNYRWRPKSLPHLDIHVSHAEAVHSDELDEEFDTFPTSRPSDLVRMRYDRLRSIAGRIQRIAGDIATQGERLQSLLSWRDPRATTLFVIFCLIAAILLYATPFYVVVIQTVLSLSRHPRFRRNQPSVPLNFFRRLPSRADCML